MQLDFACCRYSLAAAFDELRDSAGLRRPAAGDELVLSQATPAIADTLVTCVSSFVARATLKLVLSLLVISSVPGSGSRWS